MQSVLELRTCGMHSVLVLQTCGMHPGLVLQTCDMQSAHQLGPIRHLLNQQGG